jgi:hypothetical protein
VSVTTWPMRAAIALMFAGLAALVVASILRNGTMLYVALVALVVGGIGGAIAAERPRTDPQRHLPL